MADCSFQAFRDEALRYEVDPLHLEARVAVECAREAEVMLGMTLAQARDWAHVQLSGKPLRELAHLVVHCSRPRKKQLGIVGACSRCESALAPLKRCYELMLDRRSLGMKFCSYGCAAIRLDDGAAGPFPFLVKSASRIARAA